MARRRWLWLSVPAVLVAALIAVYFSLDVIMARVTQRRLDRLPGLQGTFSRVHVTLFPPGYDIYHIKLREKPLRPEEEPIAYAERAEMKWEWRELIKLRAVRKIKIWNAKFVVQLRPEETGKDIAARRAKEELPSPMRTSEKLESMQPFRLERVELINGQLLLVDRRTPGHPDIWVHDIQATLENLASRPKLTYGKPVLVAARAIVQRSGKFDLFLTADPLDKALTFAGQARLQDLALDDLYDYVVARTGLEIPRGTLDVFASFTCHRGLLTGGVKPVLKNVKVRAARPGFVEKVKAALADAAVELLSDKVPGRNAVATIIPIHGDLRDPHLQLVPTVLAVVRNAFVEGLSDSLSNLPPPEAPKKEGIVRQARRALSRDKGPPVKAQPEKK